LEVVAVGAAKDGIGAGNCGSIALKCEVEREKGPED